MYGKKSTLELIDPKVTCKREDEDIFFDARFELKNRSESEIERLEVTILMRGPAGELRFSRMEEVDEPIEPGGRAKIHAEAMLEMMELPLTSADIYVVAYGYESIQLDRVKIPEDGMITGLRGSLHESDLWVEIKEASMVIQPYRRGDRELVFTVVMENRGRVPISKIVVELEARNRKGRQIEISAYDDFAALPIEAEATYSSTGCLEAKSLKNTTLHPSLLCYHEVDRMKVKGIAVGEMPEDDWDDPFVDMDDPFADDDDDDDSPFDDPFK